jgi:micrococcal nuclease
MVLGAGSGGCRGYVAAAGVLALLSILIVAACGGGVTGRVPADVVSVYDGDSITVRYESGKKARVRLIGIDAPEMTDIPRARASIYAVPCRDYLDGLLAGKHVLLEYDVEKTDHYGRTLAYVFLPGGLMVNEEMLRAGYARLLTVPPNVKYVDRFRTAQKEARAAGRGLWE